MVRPRAVLLLTSHQIYPSRHPTPIFHLPLARGAPSPICSMGEKNNQPNNECECSGWQRDEHKPTHHAEGIKQMSIVFPVDHTGMNRSFIHATAVCVSN